MKTKSAPLGEIAICAVIIALLFLCRESDAGSVLVTWQRPQYYDTPDCPRCYVLPPQYIAYYIVLTRTWHPEQGYGSWLIENTVPVGDDYLRESYEYRSNVYPDWQLRCWTVDVALTNSIRSVDPFSSESCSLVGCH